MATSVLNGNYPFGSPIYSKAAIDLLLSKKQDLLTFDDEPTDGSMNPVTSAGIKVALDDIRAQLVSVFHFKGSVPYFDDLPPAADNKVGDVWNVEEDDMNYAWVEDSNDGHWDQLGPSLQDYLTKELAAETYLSKEDAQRLYLAIADAAATYLTKTDAASTYLSKTDASNTYLTKTDASGTYATQTTINTHIADKTNPHEVTGQQVGVLDSSGKIGANLVVESSIADGAVSTAKIGLKQVTGARIADNTLLNSNFSDNSIAGGRIQANTITGAQNNQDTSQASGKLAYNTVGTVNLRDGAVTADKIDQTVLGNLATKADATLTSLYSDAPTFSEWTFSDVSDGITNIQQPVFISGGNPRWSVSFGYDGETKTALLISDDKDADATNLAFVYEDEGLNLRLTATRTRTDILGYQLGSQEDKPLAPAGDYALKSELPDVPVKSVKRNGTALTPDAQGAVNVEVPVTSVNGKTGAVMLDGSIIPIADAATTTVLEAFQQVLSTANSKYTKPSGGIPASDLAAGVIPAVPVKAVKRNGTALTPDANGAVDVTVPTGTAASKDVPTSGNASSTQVVMGNDTRLSDARTPTEHTHSSIVAGDTTVSAVNGGTATISESVLDWTGNVVYPDGYTLPSGMTASIEYDSQTGMPSNINFFVGEGFVGGGSFTPYQPSQPGGMPYCATESIDGDPQYEFPQFALIEAQQATVTKTIATTDQIPSVPTFPLSVANGGTGATTAAAARSNLGAMAATATGEDIIAGGGPGATLSIADNIEGLWTVKADLDSPTFTGTPVAPTPQAGEDSDLIATTAFVQTAIAGKQDTISDLATIRSGAAAGATAVQPGDFTFSGTGVAVSQPTATSVNVELQIVGAGGVTATQTSSDTWEVEGTPQVQSDWSQTDSSEKDFIKNKPTIPTSFDRIVSHDGNTSVVANDGGTATLEVAGATIGDNDPLSDLADYLGLGDNATLDDVRQALGLSVDATLEDAVQAVPTSSEKTIATLDDLEPKLDADQRNIVPYAASADLTLDPEVEVYRLSPTGTSIAIPTPVTTALTATDGYYQFEIELAVPSTATSLTAPSGWTWLTGFELPASGYAGKTVYVSCRMDLRGDAVTASCWRVA